MFFLCMASSYCKVYLYLYPKHSLLHSCSVGLQTTNLLNFCLSGFFFFNWSDVWGGLTNSGEKREGKGKGEKERYAYLNVEFQRIASREKKDFLSDQWKEIEGNNRMGKTRESSQEN